MSHPKARAWRGFVAFLAALIIAAGLIAYDTTRAPAASAATSAAPNYGSGTLLPWTGRDHGVDGNPATADVLIVGDSVTMTCRSYVRAELARYGLTVVFDYWSGRPTAGTGAAVDRALSYSRLHGVNRFKAVAMATGSNDIFNPPAMAPAIDRMKASDAEVVWVNVFVHRWAQPQSVRDADLRNTGWINNQIAASGFPVVRWFEAIASKPARETAYLGDGLHPNGPGCGYYAAVAGPQIAAIAS